jgi:hypothetical protein
VKRIRRATFNPPLYPKTFFKLTTIVLEKNVGDHIELGIGRKKQFRDGRATIWTGSSRGADVGVEGCADGDRQAEEVDALLPGGNWEPSGAVVAQEIQPKQSGRSSSLMTVLMVGLN